jgi:transcription antitermination factor NusG
MNEIDPTNGNRASQHALQWYAVRVKANRERVTAASFGAKGLDHCLPISVRRRRRLDRMESVERPLFPGYVFCQFQRSQRTAVLATPGVVHVVSSGGLPIPVDPEEMSAIRAVCQSGLDAEPCDYLEVGQSVLLVGGPLAGLRGLICNVKAGRRVVVNVSLLRRAVCLEVHAAWLEPESHFDREDPPWTQTLRTLER